MGNIWNFVKVDIMEWFLEKSYGYFEMIDIMWWFKKKKEWIFCDGGYNGMIFWKSDGGFSNMNEIV